jgi:hypothetical protein
MAPVAWGAALTEALVMEAVAEEPVAEALLEPEPAPEPVAPAPAPLPEPELAALDEEVALAADAAEPELDLETVEAAMYVLAIVCVS